jgi:hypothetical protein
MGGHSETRILSTKAQSKTQAKGTREKVQDLREDNLVSLNLEPLTFSLQRPVWLSWVFLDRHYPVSASQPVERRAACNPTPQARTSAPVRASRMTLGLAAPPTRPGTI